MTTTRGFVALTGVMAIVCCAASAQAQAQAQAQGASAPEAAEHKKPFEASAGLKLFAGGNLFTTPSDRPPTLGGSTYEGIGFAGNGGGFGWGAALYGEGRLFQHLGLELDLGYDSSTVQRNVTYNGVVEVDEKFTVSSLRFAALLKGILPTPFGRMWLGVGPELVQASSVDASIEVTDGEQFVPNADALNDIPTAEKVNSTNVLMGFGLVIHAGDLIEVPIDVRAAKNMSQESKWEDRVDADFSNQNALRYTVNARSSWEFRLAAGIGARF